MAYTSTIEWTDATVNFWWGCTKVGPGCDHCYAETLSRRFGGDHWGKGRPRSWKSGALQLIHKLNRESDPAHHPNKRRIRVFMQSMSDLFDLDVPDSWFQEAWAAIHASTHLDIQIVTKRVSAIEKRIGQDRENWPQHAGLIVTVTSQAEADRDIPRLLSLMAHFDIPWIGLSCEPLLGPIILPDAFLALGTRAWVIDGGESGPHARPRHPDWSRSLRDQCAVSGVPYYFKQWGHWYPQLREDDTPRTRNWLLLYPDGLTDIPDDRYPLYETGEIWCDPVGKARAGRLLDGIEHNGMPVFRRAG